MRNPIGYRRDRRGDGSVVMVRVHHTRQKQGLETRKPHRPLQVEVSTMGRNGQWTEEDKVSA